MGKKTIELLDRISDALDDASDYEIAQKLEVTRATVSKWRTGHGTMSDETAIKAASLLRENKGALIAEIAAERATTEAVKKSYLEIAGRLRGAAVLAIAFGAGILGLLSPSPAKAVQINSNAMYIM